MSRSIEDVHIISSCRTPIGEFLGGLKNVPVTELGTAVARAAIERAEIEAERVEEVIFGNVLTAGVGQAPARQVQLESDIPVRAGALTINKVCGSGLKAVILGAQAIMLGDHDCVLVGGMESMSQAPYSLHGARDGLGFGGRELTDTMIHDGLRDAHHGEHMGQAAERIAEEYDISREEQDQFAIRSHRRAIRAWSNGVFDREVVPVRPSEGPGAKTLKKDERPRENTSTEQLATLSPAFREEGTVTAGNASGISDGASALVMASRSFVDQNDLSSQVCLTGYATGGVEPERVMLAPIDTVQRHEQNWNVSLSDMDLIEINEAFSVQGCCLADQMNLPEDRFNMHGGAVALGHPIGCTGARILTTLINALHWHDERHGLAALCLGGGNGVSVSVRKTDRYD